jgi:uncharacterized protein YndB with AHSA1/START domain
MANPATVDTKPSLALKRRINAPPAKVYEAWTDPAKLARWFGPRRVESVQAETDVRVGGRYRMVAHSADGEVHEVGGTYREVIANEKLVFTWAWRSTPERESLVTVQLRPDGNGTLLTLTHEQFFDEPARERHLSGWTEALNKLAALFA